MTQYYVLDKKDLARLVMDEPVIITDSKSMTMICTEEHYKKMRKEEITYEQETKKESL